MSNENPSQRSSGGETQTVAATQTEINPILRLKNTHKKERIRNGNRVQWSVDVVDNENMNKKKSKICCIFHPQREFDESSSSSSESDSDSESDSETEHKCCHDHGDRNEPNAYEKQPIYKNKSKVPESAV